MKILLTGAGGFLGRSLARRWANSHELTLIEGREDFSAKLCAAENIDWLVHAGFEVSFRNDPACVARNIASSIAIIEAFAAGKFQNLLFVSAAGVMGVNALPEPLSEQAAGTTSPGFEAYRGTAYIQAKLESEKLFRAAGIPLTVAYPSTVFGPGMPRATLASLRRGMICPPGGSSFLGLDDFLRAMDLLLSAPAKGEGFILNGGNLPFADLFRLARGAAPKPFIILPKVLRPLLKLAGAVAGDSFLSLAVMESAFGFKYYSSSRITNQISWQPRQDIGAALASATKGMPGG